MDERGTETAHDQMALRSCSGKIKVDALILVFDTENLNSLQLAEISTKSKRNFDSENDYKSHPSVDIILN